MAKRIKLTETETRYIFLLFGGVMLNNFDAVYVTTTHSKNRRRLAKRLIPNIN